HRQPPPGGRPLVQWRSVRRLKRHRPPTAKVDRAPGDPTPPHRTAVYRRRAASAKRECAWPGVGTTPGLHRFLEAVRERTPAFRRVPAHTRHRVRLHGNGAYGHDV